ncbi:hypothetical protein WA158_005939 [Blastocystis sp. Blastoise]
MSEELFEDKYLFTFQDETQLWIPTKVIEKYPQLPFYDIIKYSDKYDDGSYYIDRLPFHMDKVISFLKEDNINIDSLNLQDGYDIYKTLLEYSIVINDEIPSYLLFHFKELFYNYLNENNYSIYKYVQCEKYQQKISVPIELYNIEEKEIHINGLFTPQRKDELLYYSLLIKMMNIIKVEIRYDYASNIPLEYICPSNIKDIFPLLQELHITAMTHYKKTELLLNPNSDEYIMEYIRIFYSNDYEIHNFENYNCYTDYEMNKYNKNSSLDLNNLYYSEDMIDSYIKRKEKSELPKLYKYIVNEAIYTNDYSNVEISETKDENTLNDKVIIIYDDKTNDRTFYINKIFSEYGMSQLLRLSSYFSISQIKKNTYDNSKYESIILIKAFEEGIFDSLTTLSVGWIKELTHKMYNNLLKEIMTTHVFPNVTEIIYNDKSFQLSLLKKECFPKLHIINYDIEIYSCSFDSFFPIHLISMIDTIHIHENYYGVDKQLAFLDDLVYTNSIHIDGIDIFDSSDFEFIRKLYYFEKYTQNIDCLSIQFTNDNDHNNHNYDDNSFGDIFGDNYNHYNDNYNQLHKIDMRNSLEKFMKSYILRDLNSLNVSFDYNVNIKYLEWISSFINDIKLNSIQELFVDFHSIKTYASSSYFSALEIIVKKLLSKTYIVTIEGDMAFINQLIMKGCFHKIKYLTLNINDMNNDDFYQLYTTENFPQLKSITFRTFCDKEWCRTFIQNLCKYIHKNNFPTSSIIQLINKTSLKCYYTYDPNTSILRCKHYTISFIDTLIGTNDIYDEKHLSKLISFITTGKIPKLREFYFIINPSIYGQINIYKKPLEDSLFIQQNHVCYKFD